MELLYLNGSFSRLIVAITILVTAFIPAAAQDHISAVRQPLVPFSPQPLFGVAFLPHYIDMGFEVDLAGVILNGDWSVNGTIKEIEDESIKFVTDGNEIGTLVYRLPDNMRLDLVVGQNLSMRHSQQPMGKSFPYALSLKSDGKSIFSASRINLPQPPQKDSSSLLPLLPGFNNVNGPQIIYWARINRENPHVDTNHGRSFNLGIDLALSNDTPLVQNVNPGQMVSFNIGPQSYSFALKTSFEFIPNPEFLGLTDRGYMMEYFLIEKLQ